LSVYGREIEIYLKEIVIYTRNWINPVHDRDHWKAFENAALTLIGFISHESI
jgi:hypothetical protein